MRVLGLGQTEEGAIAPAPAMTPEKAMFYASASVAGGALGGAIMGLIASSDLRGAQTGAFFTAGMASFASAVQLTRADQTALGVLFGLCGLAGVAGSVYMSATRVRTRRY